MYAELVKQLLEKLDDALKYIDYLKRQIQDKDTKISQLQKDVNSLESRVDNLEQWGRRGSMRIQGIPESESEEVDQKVLALVNEQLKLSPPLIIDDIEVAHRLPGGTATSPQGQPAATPRQSQGAQQEANSDTLERPSPPRTVIVKFTSRRTKSRVMALRKELKEFNKSPENTDPAIYFQDDLTAPRAKLAYQARVLKREKCIADTWVIDSKIYVKDLYNRIKLLKSPGDLEKFKKQWWSFKI